MMSSKQSKAWFWPVLILTLLTALNILSLTDRFLIAAFGAQITTELNLSNQQFGLLTGFGFVLFYALIGIVQSFLNKPGTTFGVTLSQPVYGPGQQVPQQIEFLQCVPGCQRITRLE